MILVWFPTWEILAMGAAAFLGALLFGNSRRTAPAIDVDGLVRVKELERWNRTR